MKYKLLDSAHGRALVLVLDDSGEEIWIPREKYEASILQLRNISKRELRRRQTEKFQDDFIKLMSDGVPRCLGLIGPFVGNTYITGLSARVRGLRKTLPFGYIIEFVKVGTPDEGTWYRLVIQSKSGSLVGGIPGTQPSLFGG